jgi:hypothetical protein
MVKRKQIKRFKVNEYTKVEKIKDLSGLFVFVMLGYIFTVIFFLG